MIYLVRFSVLVYVIDDFIDQAEVYLKCTRLYLSTICLWYYMGILMYIAARSLAANWKKMTLPMGALISRMTPLKSTSVCTKYSLLKMIIFSISEFKIYKHLKKQLVFISTILLGKLKKITPPPHDGAYISRTAPSILIIVQTIDSLLARIAWVISYFKINVYFLRNKLF